MNIVDLILFQCRFQPPAAALCAPGVGLNLLSYGRLDRFIRNIGARAAALGIARGNVVALFIKDQILHTALMLGLCRLGVITLSGRSAELPKELKIDAVISDVAASFKNAGRFIPFDMSWVEGEESPIDDAKLAPTPGDETCRIVLTSGSTGDAKAVAFSHDMVFTRTHRHNTVFGAKFADSTRTLVDLGLSTGLGFISVIYTLSRGGTVFFRGSDAIETMQAFGLYTVQAMVGTPAGLAEFVDCYEQAPMFGPSLEVIVMGGSTLLQSLSERARARLCSNLIAAYGSTESGMVAAAPSHAIAHVVGAVGYVAPGISVQIVDHAGNVLAPGKEGLVRIRSDSGATGYLGDPAGSRESFRDGWCYSGDIGMLTADRLLIISGREKAVLNLGGDKVSPERIEQVLSTTLGLGGQDEESSAGFGFVVGAHQRRVGGGSDPIPDEGSASGGGGAVDVAGVLHRDQRRRRLASGHVQRTG
jgi:acyl-CoA synthetase (AMP-forming)/AMP-acid ligase II